MVEAQTKWTARLRGPREIETMPKASSTRKQNSYEFEKREALRTTPYPSERSVSC